MVCSKSPPFRVFCWSQGKMSAASPPAENSPSSSLSQILPTIQALVWNSTSPLNFLSPSSDLWKGLAPSIISIGCSSASHGGYQAPLLGVFPLFSKYYAFLSNTMKLSTSDHTFVVFFIFPCLERPWSHCELVHDQVKCSGVPFSHFYLFVECISSPFGLTGFSTFLAGIFTS